MNVLNTKYYINESKSCSSSIEQKKFWLQLAVSVDPFGFCVEFSYPHGFPLFSIIFIIFVKFFQNRNSHVEDVVASATEVFASCLFSPPHITLMLAEPNREFMFGLTDILLLAVEAGDEIDHI